VSVTVTVATRGEGVVNHGVGIGGGQSGNDVLRHDDGVAAVHGVEYGVGYGDVGWRLR
jgi:hypothetical protein